MGHVDLPEEFADLLRPLRRRATLGPVAALNCDRREFALRDDQGTTMALLRDDKVTVRRGGLTTARYREVMITPIGPGLTDEQVAWLDRAFSQAGATASASISPAGRPAGCPGHRADRPAGARAVRRRRPVQEVRLPVAGPAAAADRRGRPGHPRRRPDSGRQAGRRGGPVARRAPRAGRGAGRRNGSRICTTSWAGSAWNRPRRTRAAGTGWPAGCTASAISPCWSGWSVPFARPSWPRRAPTRPARCCSELIAAALRRLRRAANGLAADSAEEEWDDAWQEMGRLNWVLDVAAQVLPDEAAKTAAPAGVRGAVCWRRCTTIAAARPPRC